MKLSLFSRRSNEIYAQTNVSVVVKITPTQSRLLLVIFGIKLRRGFMGKLREIKVSSWSFYGGRFASHTLARR